MHMHMLLIASLFDGGYSFNFGAILHDVFTGNISNLLFGNQPLGTLPFGL